MNSYQLSQSPSPVDPQTSLLHPINFSQSQESFLHSESNPYPAEDPSIDSGPAHKQLDKYSNSTSPQSSLLDQRRMSEPAALGAPPLYSTAANDSSPSRYQNFGFAYTPPPLHPGRSSSSVYVSPLHRGVSTGSLRDLRHHHFEYPPQQHQEWKHDDSRHREQPGDFFVHRTDLLDEPVSPLQSTFSHNMGGSPTSGVPYSPISDNPYGPSPPGTGTSTSSSVAPLSAGIPCSPSRSISQHLQRSLSASQLSGDVIDRKTYSFVALPGNAVKKRPRRRYDEIERLYMCSWPDCNKSYGTLNHLNAHVTMQKHGQKRSPNEFKELRKQWRKAKKEQEAAAASLHRESYSDSYDDHAYNHRYLSSHPMHHRPHSSHNVLGLASSVTIGGNNERYPAMGVDDIRFSALEREDDALGAYDHLATRQRYNNVQPSSWHGGSNLTPRSSMQNFGPGQHPHHSHLPQLSIGNRISQQAQEAEYINAQHNRLPHNSTLLTPLYPGSSLMPPLQNGSGSVAYTAEGFEIYEDDNGRPGTGHASIASMGHASGDDFDHSQ
ncbi:C2H2 finger domain transcription factor CON7 [Psilocybe cubensis]|uniref:C2H2 finger domain transcription factor CON7 n=2 Tax=Psilocybe cubensis TaxID=181762 RepID=A0ACB8GV73_PSICU|nr:C2H2 finger domain transcription factor CON7 [Psilocybe cubensis]KAH9479428.1 C2H2 finger domain transcription factor CON7 [Psilocybe cubensis]